MTLNQFVKSSLCMDIYHALGGIQTYRNAARLKFDHTAKQALSQHHGVDGQHRWPACKRGNCCFAVTVELVVLILMVLWAVLSSNYKDQQVLRFDSISIRFDHVLGGQLGPNRQKIQFNRL